MAVSEVIERLKQFEKSIRQRYAGSVGNRERN